MQKVRTRRRRINKKKEQFLQQPERRQSVAYSGIEEKCKFNFDYFDDMQAEGQSFADWQLNAIKSPDSDNTLLNLMTKLQHYSAKSLYTWTQEKRLVFYGEFPAHSKFRNPAHVPEDVDWGHFRLSGKVRLVGFRLKQHHVNTKHHTNDALNTFYVVFLDQEHRFYPTEPSNT